MKKKSLHLIALLIILGAILYLGSKGFKFQLPSGWTTLSLTQAQFTSTAPGGLQPPVWILTVTQGGLAQSAQGFIDNDQVGAMSGTKPQYDLQINMNWDKMSWEYPIRVSYSSTPVKTYQLITWDDWRLVCFESDIRAKCGDNYYASGKFPWSATCFCIKEKQETSYMGYLDNCNIHSISTISLNAKGQTYSAKIDTKGQISNNVGPYAYVVWNGNLVKQNCPSQSPYVPFYQNGWKLGDSYYYNDYKQYYNDLIEYMAQANNNGNWDRQTLETKINFVNSKATQFLTNIKQILNKDGQTGAIIDSFNTDNAYVDLPVSSDVQVPVYTIYVSASWLGIYQPQPKPQILEARGTNFKTGEYGFLYVKFQNVGDSGNFEIWAECKSPINVLDTTKTIGVNAGSVGETYIKVGGNINTRTCDYCTIKVKGAGTNNVDSRSVQVCIDPQYVCNPGDTMCSSDLTRIEKCNQAGSGWDIVKYCSENEYCSYVNGQPTCVQKGGGGGGGTTCGAVGAKCGSVLDLPCCEGLSCEGALPIIGGGTCQKTFPIPWTILIPTLFAILAFLLLYYYFKGETKAFRFAIGIVGAIIVWLIVFWIVKNWLLILLAGLSGFAIYLIVALGLVAIGGPILVLGGKKK
jgi:hypothetical protein